VSELHGSNSISAQVEPPWNEWETLIRRDPGARGVASFLHQGQPLCYGNLERAARNLARSAHRVAIVTGFCIADAEPPAAETDGPPGALYLARALVDMGVEVVLLTDRYGHPVLTAGATLWNLSPHVEIDEAPLDFAEAGDWITNWLDAQCVRGLTHVVAIERVGPSHTAGSVRRTESPEIAERFALTVPPEHHDAHHNMRGKIIDEFTAPLGLVFDRITAMRLPVTTIGIGDGGNELGMGAFPWSVLSDAIRIGSGAWTACRIAADFTIVAGVSNWGAYALGLGVAALRGKAGSIRGWGVRAQQDLIEHLVESGAVDGVSKQRRATVDGLEMRDYLAVLKELLAIMRRIA
jgi:hypothetical protein